MNAYIPGDGPREVLLLIHHHPGRLRVRADAFRGREGGSAPRTPAAGGREGGSAPGAAEETSVPRPLYDAAERVRAALDAEPGVSSVSHNAKTGSLLIEYEPGLAHPEAILQRIALAAGLEMPADDTPLRGREPALVAIEAASELNDLVHEVTGFRGDLRVVLPAGLAALAAYSFAFHKDARLPRWDNLLYWSYNIFSQLHRREIESAARLGATTAPPSKLDP